MIFRKAFFCAALVSSLASCGGTIAPSRTFDPAFYMGAESSDASANGLAFADGSQTISDTEEQLLAVRLVRFERDPETGATILVATDETVTLPRTFTEYDDFDATITLDGEAIDFDGGVATLPNGQNIWSYLNYRLEHSGTGAVYAYASQNPEIANAHDLEGFYAIGFETDPDVVASRSSQVSYVGSFFGYAQTFDGAGNLIDAEVRTTGAVSLEAEFANSRVSGRLEGRLDPTGDPRSYELIFLGAPIIGNGFVGAADITCPSGHSCKSNSSVGGVFYGPNGEEITGVIALDETVVGPDGTRFIGAAGFSSTSDIP